MPVNSRQVTLGQVHRTVSKVAHTRTITYRKSVFNPIIYSGLKSGTGNFTDSSVPDTVVSTLHLSPPFFPTQTANAAVLFIPILLRTQRGQQVARMGDGHWPVWLQMTVQGPQGQGPLWQLTTSPLPLR